MRTSSWCLLLSTCLIVLNSSAYGDEARAQDKVLVVSETTIRTENNDRIDRELEIDKQLKESIEEYLTGRKIFLASGSDDADYVLAYNLKKVERTARIKIAVSFRLFKKSGDQVFDSRVKRVSGRAAARKAARLIADEAAEVLSEEGRRTTLTPEKAERKLPENNTAASFQITGGNAERLREERKGMELITPKDSITSSRENGLIIGAAFDGGRRTDGWSQHVSFERKIFERTTIYGKAGYQGYTYHKATYEENGRGTAVELGVNFYATHFPFKGLYYGMGLGRWSIRGNWKADSNQQSGTERGVFSDYNLHLGYKLPLDRNFILFPQVQAGIIDCHGNLEGYKTPGFHLNLGVSAGYTW